MSRPTFILGKDRVYEYATEEELLKFANTVRKAGGANVIDAFMPSVPGNNESCLIANALNFSCAISPLSYTKNTWKMIFPTNMSPSRIGAIAAATKTKILVRQTDSHSYELELEWAIELPEHIGNAAWAFDRREGWTTKYAESVKEIFP